MKTLTSRLALTLLAITLASPAMAQDGRPAKTTTCKAGSTKGNCLLALITTLQGQVAALQTALTAVQNDHALALGPYVSINNGTLNGLAGPHIIFSGANVHVENGAALGVINGLGNLIVGADDDNGGNATIDANRTGSHNLVVGDLHQFTNYDGFVAGLDNTISGINASVSGGVENTASGNQASVSGGSSNTASELDAAVSGGSGNAAGGEDSVVSGGAGNTASANFATVGGGEENTASSDVATVSGGECNTAGATASGNSCSPRFEAQGAVVSGGIGNLSSGQDSSVGGGTDQTESSNGTNLN